MRRHSGMVLVVWAIACGVPAVAAAQVLRVGSFHGVAGQFSSIQRAVDAARPGDWVLVGPGDHKTTGSRKPAGQSDFPAAVLMTTPHVYLRGMNRNTTVIDGTKPGSPQCSSAMADQNFGPSTSSGSSGLNGVMVWKAADVWVQNLTACNFLGGAGGQTGNEIWWNGGADSGQVGGYGYLGSYLTATSTFFHDEATAAQYGIFSSNWSGGTWDQIYASNFNDSGFYIGACQDVCNQVLDHGWSENNALGYSGTNSGGSLVIEYSQFDHNEDGFDTNSQNADFPPPQDGTCPNGGTSPITHTHSCWVFFHNYVHDNNNPNVPTSGSAAAGPVGTGMSVSGARNDTVLDNVFANNGAWGTIFVPYPDSGPPCTGGTQTQAACIYDEYGDALIGNTYLNNGFFGNPSNGDFAAVNVEPGPTDCYADNTDPSGAPASSSPAGLEQTNPSCNGQTVPPTNNPVFLQEAACDSQSIQLAVLAGSQFCPPGANYPRQTQISLAPLPSLPTMPHPCSGLTPDPWCSGQVITMKGCSAPNVAAHLNLAVRERFSSVRVRVGHGRAALHRARNRHTIVRFDLGRGHAGRRVRVGFLERIRVGRHRERITFTRIYTVCGGHTGAPSSAGGSSQSY